MILHTRTSALLFLAILGLSTGECAEVVPVVAADPDNARKALDQLAAAAVAQAESPERLRSAIDQLDSESADAQLAAARTLLGGGNAAVAELVAAAVSENPPAPRDDILRTIVELGPGGTRALRQLALYASPPIRGPRSPTP